MTPTQIRALQTNHNRTMKTYYGFSSSNDCAQPAWFHTQDAAERFAAACGWDKAQIETSETPNPPDIMDGPDHPWSAHGDLHNYKTGMYIRPATKAEAEASRDAGPEGVIRVEIDGHETSCYVPQ